MLQRIVIVLRRTEIDWRCTAFSVPILKHGGTRYSEYACLADGICGSTKCCALRILNTRPSGTVDPWGFEFISISVETLGGLPARKMFELSEAFSAANERGHGGILWSMNGVER